MEAQAVAKPWGHYVDHVRTPSLVVKTITVRPRCRLSLQRHITRQEHWLVISGRGWVQIGNNGASVDIGSSVDVRMGEWHRIVNNDTEPLILIEVQTGDCREDDIERTEDDYGRA